MLAVTLTDVTFRHKGGFALDGVSVDFPPGTHTAIAATGGAGSSTLLRLIAGELEPARGEVRIGDRVVNRVRPAKRPLLFVTATLPAPGRWAVDHVLVAGLRDRSLDRIDRQREYALAVEKWGLEELVRRRVDTLADSERTLLHLAWIELRKPAILLADRVLARLNPAERLAAGDQLFRTLRVIGATVINVPTDPEEYAFSDRVVALERGLVAQVGSSAEIYAAPATESVAEAGGAVNAVPVILRGGVVECAIGRWEVASAPFEGTGLALIRPEDFEVAKPGEESDFVFSIEEAGFAGGRWHARGMLSGGTALRVELPRETAIRKGRLLALRFDPARVRLVPRDLEMPSTRVPTNLMPPMRETR